MQLDSDAPGSIPEDTKVYDDVDRDWLLQHLVTHANLTKDFSRPITLWISGGLISGYLVSGKQYFDKYIEEFTEGHSEEAAEHSRKVLLEIGKRYYLDDDQPDACNTIFIHLIEAKYWSPSGALPSGNGVTWRGRLSQVTGFSLGMLRKVD